MLRSWDAQNARGLGCRRLRERAVGRARPDLFVSRPRDPAPVDRPGPPVPGGRRVCSETRLAMVDERRARRERAGRDARARGQPGVPTGWSRCRATTPRRWNWGALHALPLDSATFGAHNRPAVTACANNHRASDISRAAKHSSIDIHVSVSGTGTREVFHQSTLVHVGAAGVTIRAGQYQPAVSYLGKVRHRCRRTSRRRRSCTSEGCVTIITADRQGIDRENRTASPSEPIVIPGAFVSADIQRSTRAIPAPPTTPLIAHF